MKKMRTKKMSRKKTKVYVIHFCRNKECNNGWIDEDLTHAMTVPPKWKYCKECAEELGIDFNSQKPDDAKTKRQKERELNLRNIQK